MDPKLGALSVRSLLLYYGYVLGRVLKCVWNGVGVETISGMGKGSKL